MQVKLTSLKTFDLEINGVVFKDMRQTGELDGVIELKGNGHFATLVDMRNNFAKLFEEAIGSNNSQWHVVRGTTEVIKAAKLSDGGDISKPVLKPGSNGWILNTGHLPNAGDQHIQYQLHRGAIIFCSNKDIKNLDWTVRPHPHDTDIVKWRVAE